MNNLEKINNELNNEFELEDNGIIFDNLGDTVWFNVKSLADLFEVAGTTVQNNINDIFDDRELPDDCFESYKNINKNISLYPQKLSRGKKSTYYNLEVFNSLGFRLRSKKAIEFRVKINKLLEGIRKGELKVVDTKSIFEEIANKKTTLYRKKVSQKQLQTGKSEKYVETREYNVKLNTELRNSINNEGLSGYIVKFQKKLGKVAYDMTPSEFRKKNNITNSQTTRDFSTHNQNKVIRFLEEELLEMIVNHKGKLTKRHFEAYVSNCSKRGSDFSRIIGNRLNISPSNDKQTDLDGFK